MSTFVDDRQVVDRSALVVLNAPSNTVLSSTIPRINTELNTPLRLAASFPTPDANLNVQASEILAADGANKAASPVGNLVVNFPTSTVNFQLGTTTGGTFLPNSGANTITLPTSTVGFYVRAGFSLLSTNQVQVTFSAQSASLGGLPNPGTLMAVGALPIGWVDLQAVTATTYKTAGSTSNIIENAPGGTPAINRFVGASSSSSNQAYPTFFVSNQTQLTTALSALSGVGGVICFTAGFPINAVITIPSNVVLLGRDLISPVTFSAGGQFEFTGDRCRMYDMYLSTTQNLTMVYLNNSNYTLIERSRFSAPPAGSAVCIQVSSNATDINNCEFNGVSDGSTSTGIYYPSGFSENTEDYNVFTG